MNGLALLVRRRLAAIRSRATSRVPRSRRFSGQSPARRPFFVMAELAENARREAQGKKPAVISPLALEAVRRIDALFEIERAINGQSAEKRRASDRSSARRSSPIWKPYA